ncbi:hypothetical protein ACOSQ2_015388 [Xanthoceras sorbifolium]
MQVFSTPNDFLPGSIRASDQVVNVERQLPITLPNNGAFDSRTQQAVAPMLNAASGLHGGTTALRLQTPPLAMGGTTQCSPLVPETPVTSSMLTPHDEELVNPNPLAFNSDVARRFTEMEALIQRIPIMSTHIEKSVITHL